MSSYEIKSSHKSQTNPISKDLGRKQTAARAAETSEPLPMADLTWLPVLQGGFNGSSSKSQKSHKTALVKYSVDWRDKVGTNW